MYTQELIDAGLNEREARVYLAALELGETTVDRIAKKSGVKRTTVYLEAEGLKAKGLLSVVQKGKKSYLFAEDPRILERRLEEKKFTLTKSMPGILALANFIDRKPIIRYFEGSEGMKEIFNDILQYPDNEVCTWYSEDYMETIGQEFFNDYYIPKRIEKRIWTKAIHPDNEIIRQKTSDNEKELRRSKFVRGDKFKLPIEIMVYGGRKVGIISLHEKISMIIESEKVNQSMKNIFDAMWDILPDK